MGGRQGGERRGRGGKGEGGIMKKRGGLENRGEKEGRDRGDESGSSEVGRGRGRRIGERGRR